MQTLHIYNIYHCFCEADCSQEQLLQGHVWHHAVATVVDPGKLNAAVVVIVSDTTSTACSKCTVLLQ